MRTHAAVPGPRASPLRLLSPAYRLLQKFGQAAGEKSISEAGLYEFLSQDDNHV